MKDPSTGPLDEKNIHCAVGSMYPIVVVCVVQIGYYKTLSSSQPLFLAKKKSYPNMLITSIPKEGWGGRPPRITTANPHGRQVSTAEVAAGVQADILLDGLGSEVP